MSTPDDSQSPPGTRGTPEPAPAPDPDDEANGAETDDGVLSPGSTATGAGTTDQ